MNFTDVMQKHTNEELIEIVTTLRADYNPEAVLAAENELESRNVNASEIVTPHIAIEDTKKIQKYFKEGFPLKPNQQQSKNLIILIWVVLILDVVSFISSYYQYTLLQAIANGNNFPVETLTANDTRERFISLAYLVAFVISAITFVEWFRRAYYNLHQKVSHLAHSEGWAAGSWFVPIINVYRPYQIMKELYRETKEYLTHNGIGITQSLSTKYLGLWWALWLTNAVIGNGLFRISMKAKTLDQLTSITSGYMILHIIGIALAFITLKVISDYAKIEPLLHEKQL
jgi:hypothetical protein